MAQNFTTSGTLPTGPGGAALSGAELTLLGHAVDRFAAAGSAAYLTDNTSDLAAASANITENGNTITVSAVTVINPAGPNVYNIINKAVFLDSLLVMGTNNGNHINFINCNIYGRATTGNNQWSLGSSTNLTTNRARSVRISDGANATSTINLYGCIYSGFGGDYTVTGGFGRNGVQPADCINSDVLSGGIGNDTGGQGIILGRANGARYSNVNIDSKKGRGEIAAYGNVELFSNVNIGNMGWSTNTDTSADRSPSLLDRPNFDNEVQTNAFFNFNSSVAADVDRQNAAVQMIAGPVLESADNVWGLLNGVAGEIGIITATAANRTQAGLMQYWGYGNSYFSDPALTVPVQGIRLRVTSTVDDTSIDAGSATVSANTWSDGGFGAGNVGTVICDYVTNASGIFSSEKYKLGSEDEEVGYVDWINWRHFDDVGVTVLGRNTSDNRTPAGLVLAPIEQSWPLNYTSNAANSKAYNRYPISYEIRSFTNDTLLASTTVPTYEAGDAQVTEDDQVLSNTVVGISVKSQNVAADNKPSLSFQANSPVSINDIRDAYRAGWYDYTYDIANGAHLVPEINTVIGDTFTFIATAGQTEFTFGAGIDSITEVTIDETDATSDFAINGTNNEIIDYSGTALTADQVIVITCVIDEITTSVNTVAVRGNSIAGTTGDLFTTDAELGTGRFGGASLDGHVLTYSGDVTDLGSVTNSTITAPSIALTSTSASNNSTFSGDVSNASDTSFADGTTETNNIFTGGTISFTGLTADQEYSAEDLLGEGYSATGTVTIVSSVAITLATNDANVVGSAAGTETGAVTKEAATILYNVNVTIPTGSNGFLTVRNLGGNTNLQELTITNGVLSAPVNEISNKNPLNIGIFYKLNSTTGSSGTVYRTRLVTVNGNPGADVSVEPSVVNSVFTNGSQELSTYSIQFAASTGASIRGTFSATSAAVSENTSRAQGQGSIILATNQANYFNWVVLNEWAQDPVDYLTGEVLFNNDVADVPTGTTPFGTANGVILVSNTNDTQTIVHNFTGQLTNLVGGSTLYTGSGVRQVLNVPIGSATTATVANAVRDVVSTELLPVESNQERITENQRGLETAVRRGAVKAAAYSSENVKLTTDA